MDRTNILLAEDDTDDYRFFAEALEKISPEYIITRVKNGLECITYLKTHERPEIIFLDLNIPIKNGLECLKYIKDNQGIADIPVILYSTSHYIKHIDSAFKSNAHYYIVKPSDEKVLIEILTTVINRLNESMELPGKENFVVRNAVTLEG